ncbi:ribbon-helix-helix domain-containing protein [Novispirillum sp. DQ9]|uniref:ribbon-helix-helix domain-containing protein n=1 Tax=Novispirillum sp. DQ9 TaxID=3398612 RepID=UPI003C7DFF60
MSLLAGGAIVKRSVRVAGHPTSVSLEDAFWAALKDIAAARGLSLNALIAEIDSGRVDAGEDAASTNLSSAIRVHVLEWYRGIARP